MKWYERALSVISKTPMEFIEGLLYSRFFLIVFWLVLPSYHLNEHLGTVGLWGTDVAKYLYATVMLVISVPGLLALFNKSWTRARRHKIRAFTSRLAFVWCMFLGALDTTSHFGNGSAWTHIIIGVIFATIYIHVRWGRHE